MASSYDKSSQALRAAATLRLRVCVLRALGCPPRRRRGVSPTALPRPRLAAPLPAPGLRVADGASVVSTGADRAAPIVAIDPTCGSQRQAVLAIGVAALRAAEQLARDAASVGAPVAQDQLLLHARALTRCRRERRWAQRPAGAGAQRTERCQLPRGRAGGLMNAPLRSCRTLECAGLVVQWLHRRLSHAGGGRCWRRFAGTNPNRRASHHHPATPERRQT